MPSRLGWSGTVLAALFVAASTIGAPDGTESPSRGGRSDAVANSALLSHGAPFVEQSRPNIVVIMADDMRADEIVHMPRTRALLEDEGVRYDNAMSPNPLCCPARASFVSGKYTHNHKVWTNRGEYGGFARLDDSASVAVGMSRAGYETVFLGKYLNGYGKTLPADGSNPVTYIPPGWTDWRGSVDWPAGWDDPAKGGTYRYFDTTLNINGRLRPNQGWYQTRMLGAESRQIIAQHALSPRPFVLWASYVAPHIGLPREKDDPQPIVREDGVEHTFATPAVPGDVRGMFDHTITEAPGDEGEPDVTDKPFYIRNQLAAELPERAALAEVTRQRAESLEVLDQEVERTIEALEAAGELDDTIVMFTSDNGYFLGEHRVRQGKLLPYEPALRVPLLVRGPGLPAGEVRSDPVLTIDFAPTFLALAGAQPDPAMDGVTFLDPEQAGDLTVERGWTRPVVTETGPRSVRRTTEDGTLPPGANKVRFTQGVRTGRYLYVEHATGERELYDHRADPEQLRNIAGEKTAQRLVRRLATVLDRYETCRGEECHASVPESLHR